MRAEIVKAGDRFGRLVAIVRSGADRHNGPMWLFQCDCGKQVRIRTQSVRIGRSKSCGCWNAENAPNRYRTHEHTADGKISPTYGSYRGALNRCLLPNTVGYCYYGGRGITICERWQGPGGFENFLADMGERPPGTTLDRINNKGNYEPGNCRWATKKVQRDNREDTYQISHNGETANVKEWARRFGVRYSSLFRQVITLKKPFEEAVLFLQEQAKQEQEEWRRMAHSLLG